jgi:small redox-active disulfide protein 2
MRPLSAPLEQMGSTIRLFGEAKMDIAVLGPGCMNCQKVEQITKEVVAELNLDDVTFQHVTSWDEIMQYPILKTPGLVLNGQVVCSGRIPSKAEVTAWIKAAVAEGKA